MKRPWGLGRIVFAALALSSFPADAVLTVCERTDGVFAILRDGQEVVTDIRAVTASANLAKGCRTGTAGSAVWNRWDEQKGFRFEAAERTDGAIELTMVGHTDSPTNGTPCGLSFRLPGAVCRGWRWQAKLGDRRTNKDGEGVFDEGLKPFTARFLAAGGLVFDLDALGPAVYTSHANGIAGEWSVGPDGQGGVKFSGIGTCSEGGTRGAKVLIREGTMSDYSKYHFFSSFYLYWQRLFPRRLVKFGAPKAYEHYVEGNHAFDGDAGWLNGAGGKVSVGHKGGAYYSHARGQGHAVYRISKLARGYHIVTLQIGNWTGEDNGFSVAANGVQLADGISLGARKARTIARALFVEDGKVDVAFDGDWIVSGIGVQPLMSESEDFSIRRGFWCVDGYEPSPAYGNGMSKKPYVPAILDQTIDMPEPGRETAGDYREPPLPVELPDMQARENDWVRQLRMRKLLENGSLLTAFEDEARRDAVFRKTAEEFGYNAILQNGQLSRHTYADDLDVRATRVIKECARTARKYGLKYIDHLDATLLWNAGGHGFRRMMERLDEVQLDMYDNLPSFYLCPENPTFKRRLFDYLRNEVKAGVDGFQLDELTFWHHGCVCATCRERFHRETGWWLPLDETEGSSRWDSQTPLAKRRRDWQMKTLTSWRVDLRRHVKDLNPNLLMSTYSTYGSITKRPSALASLTDGARVMNLFGTEVMPRDPLRCSRPLMPLMRVKGMLRKAYGTPAWDWFYPPDTTGSYYSWALATMVGEAPLVNPVRPDPGVPDFMSWVKTARVMDPVGAKPIARVGILLSSSSIDNDPETDAVAEAFGLAQELEALHVPYEFFGEMFSKWEDVKQYDVLFLGSSRCMSDRTKCLVEALIRDGRRVYGRPGCGSRNEWGEVRKIALGGYREMPSAAAFHAPEINHDGVWDFSVDAVAEADFRRMLCECVGTASFWDAENIPDRVQTSILRERSGALTIHFLNATGCDIRKGEMLCVPNRKTSFPPLAQDIVFGLPEDVGNRAVAISPDFPGERELAVRKDGHGRIRVTLPKECLRGYTLVRLRWSGSIRVGR